MAIIKDLNITQIISVYDQVTYTWSRPKPLARQTNVLSFFRDGSVTYYFEDETVVGQGGDLLAFSKGLVYSGQKIAQKNSYFVIEFDTEEPFELERLGLSRISQAPKGTRERFRRILASWNDGDVLLCRAQIYELLHSLTYTQEEESLKKAIALMKHRISDPDLSLADLCTAVSLSESHLRRLFHQETGLSPMQYLTDLRMTQARNMLAQGDVSVGEVAEFCGYSTLYYFSRSFHSRYGMSPTQYRQINSL